MKLIGMCCQVSPLDSISYNLLTYVLRQVRTPDATIFCLLQKAKVLRYLICDIRNNLCSFVVNIFKIIYGNSS